jgi:NodT family efflux transporter outer membrane factor (OMF) lipoprotein
MARRRTEGELKMRAKEVEGVRTHRDAPHARSGGLPAAAGGVFLLLLLLPLTGCAVGPKYKRPEVKLNNNWGEQHDTHVATETSPEMAWWKSFNDPALDRLIDLAHRQNLTLQVAGLRIMESRARLGYAVGQQYPQFQAAVGNVTAVGLSKHAANDFDGLDHSYVNYEAGFDAAWEIDFWRKYASGVSAEEAGYFASVADYDNALVSLAAEVARTYSVIRTFEVLIEQARSNIKLQEEGLRIAESRFRNGATSELDVVQSKTLLESTRTTIPRFQIGLQQAQNALSTLLGETTGSVAPLLEGPKEIPTPPAQVAVSVPAEVLRRRADIRSAELNAMAQCDRIGIAKADFYPRFTLFGSIGTQTSAHGGDSELGDLFSPTSFFYSFGPRLLWPLFNYGRIKNNVRVEDARFQQSLVSYQDTVLRAAQEVEDGLAGYLRSQEAVVFAQNAAKSAQRAVDLSFLQYREGAVDFQRVLDAQRSLLQEENTLATVRSSVATNLIALYKALGGGWEIHQGQPYINEQNQNEMEERTDWGDYFTESPEPRESDDSETEPR